MSERFMSSGLPWVWFPFHASASSRSPESNPKEKNRGTLLLFHRSLLFDLQSASISRRTLAEPTITKGFSPTDSGFSPTDSGEDPD
jgi:hypothetical protein